MYVASENKINNFIYAVSNTKLHHFIHALVKIKLMLHKKPHKSLTVTQ